MKICFFPGRESSYARNRVLLKAMQETGWEVYDCSHPKKTLLRYLFGFLKFLKYQGRCNLIFVGFLGHFLVPLVRLFSRKKIIFDSFVSVHLTMVVDRKKIKEGGLGARLADFADLWPCQIAERIFAGTEEEIKYLNRYNRLPKEKFVRLFVGSDDAMFFPRPMVSEDFIVEFHGEFQDLHGVEYIIEAAALLPEVKFWLIGKGYKLNACLQRTKELQLNNVEFIPPVPFTQVPEYMAKSSVSLGIFGRTLKTQIVIPHKVYEALAMGKPIITADTPAIRELLQPERHVILCEVANPASLAAAIKRLKENSSLRRTIGENGLKVFKERCSPKVLGEQIAKTVEQIYR